MLFRSPVNQRLTGKLLERLGYSYDVVENGAQAVEAVSRHSYTMVLMDCMMPEMDGYQATREIRQRGHKLPIVAMTANAFDEDRDKCLAARMNDFLTKPVEPDRLAAVLMQHLPDGKDVPPAPIPPVL